MSKGSDLREPLSISQLWVRCLEALDSLTMKLAANDGVDVGDVTVNNAANAGAYVRPGTGATWDTNIARQSATTTATIANGAAVSGAIDLRGYAGGLIRMPAAWTAAHVGFQVSDATAGTYVPLYDRDGALVTINVAVSRAYPLPAEAFGARYVKLWSQNGAGADANQGAARDIGVDLKG